ncbi:MAG: hypothetical protein EPO32_01535 [Anaerolineae bacterium]|nr:MAG: hypothetical protein EPO32_01535 [Anaerolineae bacterium]
MTRPEPTPEVAAVLAAWEQALRAFPGGPALAAHIAPGLAALLASCAEAGQSPAATARTLGAALSPLRGALQHLTPDQQARLADARTVGKTRRLLQASLHSPWGRGLKPATRDQYGTKIARLLPDRPADLPEFGGTRQGFIRVKNTTRAPVSRSPGQQHAQATRRQERRTAGELAHGLREQFGPARPETGRKLYPTASLWVNPTPRTPGVLDDLELAIALQACDDLPEPWRSRGRLVVLGGALCGWTEQLRHARLDGPSGQRPELVRDPVGQLWLHAWQPAWVPDWLTHDPVRRAAHLAVHHEVQSDYVLPLHPVLARALAAAADFGADGRLLPGDSYSEALARVSAGLQALSPTAARLTPGRLLLSFHGRANASSYPWPARYGLTGRPSAAHTMAAAYTALPLAAIQEHHARFCHDRLSAAREALLVNAERLGAPAWPLDHELATEPLAAAPGMIGSWSTPRLAVLRDVYATLQRDFFEATPGSRQAHNTATRLALTAGAVSLLLRPADVDGLLLPERQPLAGPGFAQQVKSRPGENESWVERELPAGLQSLWWRALSAGAGLSPDGRARPWLIDRHGQPQPFRLQDCLDAALAAAGLPGQLRAHSLRHFGRSWYSAYGLNDPEIALRSNHWANGFERTNYARLGADLRGVSARFQAAAAALAQALDWEWSRWT